jgi:benzoyl-CoA reductase/2-hydroxyglutaryl-CoA dehydratase subunit BcrC/BadD/HgdB
MNEAKPLAGMQLTERYYLSYGSRARELKEEGRRFLGYMCAYVPLEIISAAGFIPFRIKGNVRESISDANRDMETIVCPVVRSCYEMMLKGAYDFIEGIVVPHACDSMCITHDIWRSTLQLPYFHVLNIPHGLAGGAREFFENSLRTFKMSLERYGGRIIEDDALEIEIAKYNHLRALARSLYKLQRDGHSRLSGSQLVRTLVAVMSLPVNEGAALLEDVAADIIRSPLELASVVPRIMVTGSEQDDDGFDRIVEECGGAVVADFLCPGMREYREDVAQVGDPIVALAARYLNLHCARTYREAETVQGSVEDRFGPIRELVTAHRVQGVIIRVHRYCDPYGLEVPALKKYLQELGVLVLYLEDDYLLRDTGRFRNRIQAFVEMLRQRAGEHPDA